MRPEKPMSDIATRVQRLSKQYRIGRAPQRHDTQRDAPVAGLRAPLERLTRHKLWAICHLPSSTV